MNERGQQWAPGAEIPPRADKIPDPPPPSSGATPEEEARKFAALLPVDDPQDWRRQNQLDLALSHAVRIACEQPRLIGSGPLAAGGERLSVEEVARRITTMARTFAEMLSER